MNQKLPALFIGHGSPSNIIDNNSYTKALENLPSRFEKPKAILVISAHWQSSKTYITIQNEPRQIYDFYGFSKEIYDIKYDAAGSEVYANEILEELKSLKVEGNRSWGIDHGAWGILKHMYPNADIPVLQLSLNYAEGEKYHYNLGKKLRKLRDKGYLIIGSGNIVHNLRCINNERDSKPYDWAVEFNSYIKNAMLNNNYDKLLEYTNAGRCAKLSVPTVEHFLPLLYIAGLKEDDDKIEIIYDGFQMSSVSMLSFFVGTVNNK